jgi:hypothetical protein
VARLTVSREKEDIVVNPPRTPMNKKALAIEPTPSPWDHRKNSMAIKKLPIRFTANVPQGKSPLVRTPWTMYRPTLPIAPPNAIKRMSFSSSVSTVS